MPLHEVHHFFLLRDKLKSMTNTNLKIKDVPYITGFWVRVGGEVVIVDQIFPEAITATLYMTTNLSWGGGGNLVQNH